MNVTVVGPNWAAGTTASLARAFTACGVSASAVHYAYWEPLCGVRKIGSWQRRLWPQAADRRCCRITHERVLQACSEGCDLLFIIIGHTVSAETVVDIRRKYGTKAVLWVVDDPFIAWNSPPTFRQELYKLMAACDSVCVFDEYYCAAITAHTGIPCRYLPLAYDESIFIPDPDTNKRYQVAMVGARFPLRAACLAALDDVTVDVWGGDFRDMANCRCHQPVPSSAANTIYNQAVVCFNANHQQSIWDNNTRVFEVAGAGGCLLTDSKQALAQQFRIGEEVLAYDSPRDFADKARYLLAHPAAVAAIGARAVARARAEHTFTQRVRTVLTYFAC